MTTDRPASGIRLRMSTLGCGAMLVRMPGYEMLDADQLRTISHYSSRCWS